MEERNLSESTTKGNLLWPQPQSRDVGVLSDPSLYAEALQIAQDQGLVTKQVLQREIGPRLRGMLFVKQQSARVARQLILELQRYGWVRADEGGRVRSGAACRLSVEGAAALAESQSNPRAFRRTLVGRMHDVFVIPGWMVNRLWQINPHGQGEVILPSPLPDWHPETRPWEDAPWSHELERQTLRTAARARVASPFAFPIEDAPWTEAVRQAWTHLSGRRPRGRRAERKPPRYSPRRRLAQAIRRATIHLLFGRELQGTHDVNYGGIKPPFYLASFEIWCARLQALEILFYTDWHPDVPGRILFPVALFRDCPAASRQFECLPAIRHPDGRPLCLHQPEWGAWRERFWQALVKVHRGISQQVRARYVSLLDVRDEVCRQLRLSAHRFEEFLERALQETPPDSCPWHISAETDLREDLRSGRGLLRRPVYIRRVPHTLIAMTCLSEPERSLS
jgi:hypothetical protein